MVLVYRLWSRMDNVKRHCSGNLLRDRPSQFFLGQLSVSCRVGLLEESTQFVSNVGVDFRFLRVRRFLSRRRRPTRDALCASLSGQTDYKVDQARYSHQVCQPSPRSSSHKLCHCPAVSLFDKFLQFVKLKMFHFRQNEFCRT